MSSTENVQSYLESDLFFYDVLIIVAIGCIIAAIAGNWLGHVLYPKDEPVRPRIRTEYDYF